MTTEPLNPSVTPLYGARFAENTSGVIAAIVSCIQAAGGTVTSYPANTAGIIQSLIDLQMAISGGGTGAQSVATLLPTTSGEALTKGDAVHISSTDGKVYKASPIHTRERANVLGLAKETVAADAALTVVARGPLEGLSSLVVGSDYYLGNNGIITTTAPTGGGVYSTFVGQAISATTIDVHPVAPIYLS